jgi:DNA/RNA-binding domain of Phe-tRNA-synthetase-like protein
MSLPTVRVAPELAGIVRLGALVFEDLRVVEQDLRLDAALRSAEAAVGANPPAGSAAVRAMYHRVGIDPTRRRPSSEALLRRVRRGDGLPRVNSLVDVCNWCSLELQLPYGLYDLDALAGGVELRLGRPGEEYAGIRKDIVHVGGRLTLADEQGAFGNPTSDSARAMVTPATARALAVIFAPREIGADRLAAALELTSARIAQYVGGRETGRHVV